MRFIKKFETFDFTQTLPLASVADLTLYYHCDNCDSLWKVVNKEVSVCKNCNSDEVEELSKDEWYETIADRLDDEELNNLKKQRLSDEEEFLDLHNLNKGYVN